MIGNYPKQASERLEKFTHFMFAQKGLKLPVSQTGHLCCPVRELYQFVDHALSRRNVQSALNVCLVRQCDAFTKHQRFEASIVKMKGNQTV